MTLSKEIQEIFDVVTEKLKEYWKDKEPQYCTFDDCDELVDVTLMGVDTSCPYHRLLYDVWLYPEYDKNMELFNNPKRKEERRKKYRKWVKQKGQDWCDKEVEKMALVPINWKC